MSAPRRLVVGLDRSPESAAALAWAAADARPGVDRLHVVHAYQLLAFTESSWEPAVRANDTRRMTARSLVAAAVRTERAARPGLQVDGSAIVGDPVTVLRDLSEVADLIVIGGVSAASEPARGPGRRIGRRVAARAVSPVVVVPDGAPPASDLPVALLLTGPSIPTAAVDFAIAAADRWGATLLVTEPWALGLPGDPSGHADVLAWQTERQKALDAVLAHRREQYPHVPVVVQLRKESGYLATRELHRAARLIVVAREPVPGCGLSAVSRLALRRPHCPVAVVPAARAGHRADPPSIRAAQPHNEGESSHDDHRRHQRLRPHRAQLPALRPRLQRP